MCARVHFYPYSHKNSLYAIDFVCAVAFFSMANVSVSPSVCECFLCVIISFVLRYFMLSLAPLIRYGIPNLFNFATGTEKKE